jgi:hypothetical protein
VDLIHHAQDRDQWQALVNKVMKLTVAHLVKKFAAFFVHLLSVMFTVKSNTKPY